METVLTSALTNKPLSLSSLPKDPFTLIQNAVGNLVIINYKTIHVVCLVTMNQVYFWKNDDFWCHRENFIFRVKYPALANLIFICWHENILKSWLLSKNKPFSSHLAFSPDCPLKKEVTPKWKLKACVDLWSYEDENLSNSELKTLKPWNISKKNLKNYYNILNTADKHEFVDYPYITFINAIENGQHIESFDKRSKFILDLYRVN